MKCQKVVEVKTLLSDLVLNTTNDWVPASLPDSQAVCLLFVSVLFCSILKETEWFVIVCVL